MGLQPSAVSLVCRSGAACDPEGKAGTATMMADLLTRGTTTMSGDSVKSIVEFLGARFSGDAGAATKLDSTGRPVPRFPNARYYAQQKEWNLALNPNRRSRAAYLPENFMPLQEAGQLELIDGDFQLEPGLELALTDGHTPGHQVVLLRSGGETAIYWGDLIPTRSHIATPYIIGYDLLPLETMAQKEKLVALAIAGRWVSFFEHDPDSASGIIEEENGRQFMRPLAGSSPDLDRSDLSDTSDPKTMRSL